MLTRARAARQLTELDSSVNAVRAESRFLHGKNHPAPAMASASNTFAGAATTSPPDRVRAAVYRVMGVSQGIPLDQVRHINVDELDEWVVQQYGQGPFPAVVIGSTSGGALHLAAALRAPFLPQTTLCAVRDLATHADDAVGTMNALAPTTRMIAENNPRVAVYHMHDPAQHRPMLEAMAYMRLKRLHLGRPYERFLEHHLAPGGTIIQVESTRQWRIRTIGERAYYQFGCLGGLSEEEYHEPGPRVAKYLEQERSPVRGWQPPEMDSRLPEAEWGWDAQLGKDVARFAERHDHPVRRLVAPEPQDLSPFVADLYRWWYASLGQPADRLLVESYVQWDPMWVLRTGSVPFWLRFNLEPDYQLLRDYLESVEPYEFIHLNLFSPGLAAPGVVPAEQWEQLLQRHARQVGDLAAVEREPIPEPLTVDDIDRFFTHAPPRYAISWHGDT